ncbi:hypothetical protein HanRHA438_Chr05g0212571 [Helianthus annuus]|nr:hypothetical protein HanIR_Chr05g0219111 [Helianthus annuus]KAJ0918003.1 hypothetical protein HanRHA438_Chr05g0212571 [Helianthus annuus]
MTFRRRRAVAVRLRNQVRQRSRERERGTEEVVSDGTRAVAGRRRRQRQWRLEDGGDIVFNNFYG